VIELAEQLGFEVDVRPLSLKEVRVASEVFVTGAIGGVEAATVTGHLPASGEITPRLANALRERLLTRLGTV
jgi:branched-subunit amino acid aminotransferase/4-amino-4-deoxychorismate lyase